MTQAYSAAELLVVGLLVIATCGLTYAVYWLMEVTCDWMHGKELMDKIRRGEIK